MENNIAGRQAPSTLFLYLETNLRELLKINPCAAMKTLFTTLLIWGIYHLSFGQVIPEQMICIWDQTEIRSEAGPNQGMPIGEITFGEKVWWVNNLEFKAPAFDQHQVYRYVQSSNGVRGWIQLTHFAASGDKGVILLSKPLYTEPSFDSAPRANRFRRGSKVVVDKTVNGWHHVIASPKQGMGLSGWIQGNASLSTNKSDIDKIDMLLLILNTPNRNQRENRFMVSFEQFDQWNPLLQDLTKDIIGVSRYPELSQLLNSTAQANPYNSQSDPPGIINPWAKKPQPEKIEEPVVENKMVENEQDNTESKEAPPENIINPWAKADGNLIRENEGLSPKKRPLGSQRDQVISRQIVPLFDEQSKEHFYQIVEEGYYEEIPANFGPGCSVLHKSLPRGTSILVLQQGMQVPLILKVNGRLPQKATSMLAISTDCLKASKVNLLNNLPISITYAMPN